MSDRTHPSGVIRLLGESIDLLDNFRRACRSHRPMIQLLLATVILDALSTTAFMFALGVEREQNPFIRQLALWLGIVAGPALGKLFQLFATGALIALAPRLARFVFAVAISLNLYAGVVNLRVFFLHG